MTLTSILAEFSLDSRWLDRSFIVPIAVGAVAGLGVVATIHFVSRRRTAPTAQPPRPQPAAAPAPAPAGRDARDPFEHGSSNEQRRAFRRKGNPIEVLMVDKAAETRQIKGHVVNRSVGGLCLAAPIPFKPDAELTICPKTAANNAPWVELVVKSCRQTNEGYEIGCQFLKSPPWPVLMMFG